MKCKHCGNEEYFYRKTYIKDATVTIYNGDETYEESGMNSNMHEPLEVRQGKFYYCQDCGRRGEAAPKD